MARGSKKSSLAISKNFLNARLRFETGHGYMALAQLLASASAHHCTKIGLGIKDNNFCKMLIQSAYSALCGAFEESSKLRISF